METNISKKLIAFYFIFLIIFIIIFVIPINMGLVFAADSGSSTSSNSVNYATKKEVGTVCGGSINVKDSLLMSIVTGCIPGILEKTNQWRQIKCQTAVCYYDAVKYGLDPTFCIKQDAYQTCKYVMGDIFALPGLNLIDFLRKKVADAMANPTGLIFSAAAKVARNVVKTSCKSPSTCTFTNPYYFISAGYLIAIDSAYLIQQIRDIFKNGFFPPLHSRNACDRLPKIKKEMDQILKYA